MKPSDAVSIVIALAIAGMLVRFLILSPQVGIEVNDVATKLFGGYDA